MVKCCIDVGCSLYFLCFNVQSKSTFIVSPKILPLEGMNTAFCFKSAFFKEMLYGLLKYEILVSTLTQETTANRHCVTLFRYYSNHFSSDLSLSWYICRVVHSKRKALDIMFCSKAVKFLNVSVKLNQMWERCIHTIHVKPFSLLVIFISMKSSQLGFTIAFMQVHEYFCFWHNFELSYFLWSAE